MHRLGALDAAVSASWTGARLAGPAATVWVRAGENAVIHEAIGLARRGDVLVVNACGSLPHAVFGELMALACIGRGVVGVVVDGCIRDTKALAGLGFPAFARGSCASGPVKEGSGEIGYPVACGGVVCAPGDVLVGDGDGVVVVPGAHAAAVLEHALAIARWEADRRRALAGALG